MYLTRPQYVISLLGTSLFVYVIVSVRREVQYHYIRKLQMRTTVAFNKSSDKYFEGHE